MIVDANVVVSAALGRSLPLVLAIADRDETLLIPEQQMREARLVTATQVERRGHDPHAAFAWAEALLLEVPTELYEGYEIEARTRLGRGGQKDWPLLALALASGDEVWSNDVDLFGTGIVVL